MFGFTGLWLDPMSGRKPNFCTFLMLPLREHTHKKNCLNLGIARKGGGGGPGLPKLLGALFFHQLIDLGIYQNGGGGLYVCQIGKFGFGFKFQF